MRGRSIPFKQQDYYTMEKEETPVREATLMLTIDSQLLPSPVIPQHTHYFLFFWLRRLFLKGNLSEAQINLNGAA